MNMDARRSSPVHWRPASACRSYPVHWRPAHTRRNSPDHRRPAGMRDRQRAPSSPFRSYQPCLNLLTLKKFSNVYA